MSDFDEDVLAGGAEPLDLSDEDGDDFAGLPDDLVEGEGLEGLIPGMHIDGDDLPDAGDDDAEPEPLF